MMKLDDNELIHKFIQHKKWIDSLGKEGGRLNLDEIDLRENNIDQGVFEQAYITECIFDKKNIKGYSFYLSKLCSSSFKECSISEVDFTKADLSYTDISDACLYNVSFNKCECIDGNFSNSKLTNVNMTDVLFDTVDLRNATLNNVDISYSSFDTVLVKGITIKHVKGIDKICSLKINIGELEKAIILQGEEAIEWLMCNAIK